MIQCGLFDHLDLRDEPIGRTLKDRIEVVRIAEDAGFRAYHLAEHHGTPVGVAPSPNIFLAALAQATTRLRLGAMVYCLPLYLPLRLLEEICMLDQLSNGRLDVGVGRGASPFESAFYGITADEGTGRYVEALEVLKHGLAADHLDFKGKYFNYPKVPLMVRPVQSRIPMWCAPATEESQRFAARDGMNIMALGASDRIGAIMRSYTGIWKEVNGESAEPPLLGAYRMVVVAPSDGEAEALAAPAYADWFAKLAKLWRENNATTPFLSIGDFATARRAGMMLCGAPATVARELVGQIEECGYNYPVLQFAFGNLGHVNECRSLELFCRHVLPALN